MSQSYTGLKLRWLDSFDCHKVVSATFTILAVSFAITQQHNFHIKITLKLCCGKFWVVTPYFFLHILFHILISNYYEKFDRYLMTFGISNLS